MCNYTAVPINDVGVSIILYIARVGCLSRLLLLLLGLLLFSLFTFFYLLFHSFIPIHPSISSPLSSHTPLAGAVKKPRSLESFGWLRLSLI